MSIIRELGIKLGLDVDAASFAEGELAAEGVKKGLEAIVEVAKKTIEFLFDVGKEAIEAAGHLNATRQSLGTTAEALQELTYAGKLSSLSAEEMESSLSVLTRTMNAAAKGGEEQSKAFAKVGVKVKDATGHLRPAEDVIGDLADHFKTMPDGADKTASSMEFFGKTGAKLIPLLNNGSEGIAELRKEARDLGIVLDEETVKLGAEVGDNLDRLKAMWTGIKNQAGAALFPVLKQLTEAALDWVKANKELIKQKLAAVFQGIAKAAKVLIEAADVLWGSLKLIYDLVAMQLVAEFRLFMGILDELGIGAKVAAAIFAGAWLIALAPVIAVVAGIAQVLLFLNSIQRFREGRDSVFGDWMKMLNEWAKPQANDPWWLKAIKDLVNYMQQALGIADKLGVAVDKIQKPFNTTAAVARGGAATVKTAIGGFTGDQSWLGKLIGGSDFAARFDAARAGGAGIWDAAGAGFGGDSPIMPSLPPGGGVMRAPVSQDNRRSYIIHQSPGMSAQEVVDLITQYDQDANDAAAAALR